MSQRQLAELAGVSLGTVRDLEQGRTHQPRPASMGRLAAVLGLAVSQDGDAITDPASEGTASPGTASAGTALSTGWLSLGCGGDPRIGILGPLVVWRAGAAVRLGPPKQRVVLGLLAMQPNRLVHRDTLIDVLWGDDPPAAAVNLIQSYVGRLRRVLDPGRRPADPAGMLVSGRTSYQLRAGPAQLDLLAAEELVAEARACADAAIACGLYERALEFWRDMPLADVDALRGHPAVTVLVQRWSEAVAGYAQAAVAAGRCDQVLPHLRALTRREPLDEKAHSHLMIALACSGQQAAALTTFDDLRRRLDDQVGVRPGAQVTETHARVLRQEIPGTAPAAEAAAYSAGRVVVPRQLPPAVGHFAGRRQQLRMLWKVLEQGGDTVVISAIGGTAGVGKTALAIHWAHQVRDRFPDGQLYVNLRGFDPGGQIMTPAEAVRGFLDAQGVPPWRIPASLDAQVGLYRSLLDGKRVLVVLDNARDAEHVRLLLPGTPTAVVVVTSRNQLVGLVCADGAHPLALDLLPIDEAYELLARHLGHERLAAEPAAAAEIIARCARLPLALSIVAARAVTNPGFPLAALAGELAGVAGRLDALTAGEPAAEVRTVFSWSYTALSPAAAALFRLLGLHPGPDVSAPAAASLARVPAPRTRALLAELTRTNLLTEHAPGRYTFHDLLRAYATDLAHHHGCVDDSAATTRLLDHYLHTAHTAGRLLDPLRDPITLPLDPAAPGVHPERLADRAQALAWLTAEHAVLVAAVRLAAGNGYDAHTWRLAWALHLFLDRQGHWDDLTAAACAALDAARRLGDPAAQAEAHRRLASAHHLLSHYPAAHVHLGHALDLYARALDRVGQADTHIGLALLYERQDRPGRALDHAQQALTLYRAAGHSRGQATALNNVGWYHALLDDQRQALTYCEQAHTLNQQLGYRLGEAATSDSLGYVHHHLGHHQQAIASYQHALDLYHDLGDRYNQADTLTRLGETHLANDSPTLAAAAWQHALAILTSLDHPDAATVHTKLDNLDQRATDTAVIASPASRS